MESAKLLPNSLMVDCLATISGVPHSKVIITSLIGDCLFTFSGEDCESDPNTLFRFYLWSGVLKSGRMALEFIWLNSAVGW